MDNASPTPLFPLTLAAIAECDRLEREIDGLECAIDFEESDTPGYCGLHAAIDARMEALKAAEIAAGETFARESAAINDHDTAASLGRMQGIKALRRLAAITR